MIPGLGGRLTVPGKKPFSGVPNYCLSSPSNEREAIQKMGSSCPLGWFSSGSYCVKNH